MSAGLFAARAGMRFGTMTPSADFDPEKPFRYPVLFDRKSYLAIRRGAAAAGMSEAEYVQAFCDTIAGFRPLPKPVAPNPDSVEDIGAFARHHGLKPLAVKAYFLIERDADSQGTVHFAYAELARRLGTNVYTTKRCGQQLQDAGLLERLGTGEGYVSAWRVTGERFPRGARR